MIALSPAVTGGRSFPQPEQLNMGSTVRAHRSAGVSHAYIHPVDRGDHSGPVTVSGDGVTRCCACQPELVESVKRNVTGRATGLDIVVAKLKVRERNGPGDLHGTATWAEAEHTDAGSAVRRVTSDHNPAPRNRSWREVGKTYWTRQARPSCARP
jgi:hypothetical protein